MLKILATLCKQKGGEIRESRSIGRRNARFAYFRKDSRNMAFVSKFPAYNFFIKTQWNFF